MRCAIYCRVSGEAQRDAGTIVSQRKALQEFAARNGWDVVALEEDDGHSGDISPWARDGMHAVLKLVRAEDIDVLLVLALDRLSRDTDNIDFALIRRELRQHKVKLATPQGVYDSENPQQRLMQDILAAVAGYERAMILERTVRGRRDSMRGGGRPLAMPPLGYGWSKPEAKMIEAPSEAAIIREIFRLLAERPRGTRAICTELKDRGLSYTRKKALEHFVTRSSIARIVTEPVYWTGDWFPHPNWMADLKVELPPLVDRATWDAANGNLLRAEANPERERGYEFLLTGKVHCARCGRRMRGQTVGGKAYAYYFCEHVRSPGANDEPCTNTGSIRADKVDPLVWGEVERFLREPGALRAEIENMVDVGASVQVDVDQGLRDAAASLRVLDAERGRARLDYRKERCTETEYEKDLADIQREREPLLHRQEILRLRKQSGVDRAERFDAVEARLAAMREVLGTLTFMQKRDILDWLVDRVVIDCASGEVVIGGLLRMDVEPGTNGDDGDGSDDGTSGGWGDPSVPVGGSRKLKKTRGKGDRKPDAQFYGAAASTCTSGRHRGWRSAPRGPPSRTRTARTSGTRSPLPGT